MGNRTDTNPLSPNTNTDPGKSIWQEIDRSKLERQLRFLVKKHHVARSHPPQNDILHEHDADEVLPSEVEQSLADDFAFLAACEPQVEFVTAAAIELGGDDIPLRIVLAANEGVHDAVSQALNKILTLLKQHADKKVTQDDCRMRLFDTILRLNCNRILGRVGSAKFKRPDHLNKDRDPLPQRFRARCQRYLSKGKQRQVQRRELERELQDFCMAFTVLEQSKPDDVLESSRSVVMRAFDLTKDGKRLPERLKELGLPEDLINGRDVREIGKVANYYRIARHMSICSRRFQHLFSKASWRPLPHFSPCMISSVIPKQFVHAEIQILVHYEIEQLPKRPRWIGVSKRACFLCDRFIHAHGRFCITGAHRQVYSQWTVPDLQEYNQATIVLFRRALSAICSAVSIEHARAQNKLLPRTFPFQSAINLDSVHFDTPSVSTIHSLDATISSVSTLKAISETSERHRDQDVPIQLFPTEIEVPIEITYQNISARQVDWIQIFASMATSSNDSASAVQKQNHVCTVGICSKEAQECQHAINVNDLSIGESMTLSRSDADGPDELSFVLVGSARYQQLLVQCQWHTSQSDRAQIEK